MISNKKLTYCGPEKSACGVGFIVSRNQEYSNEHLKKGLHALRCVEHRGACAADGLTGDGAGIMTDIPFELFGYEPDTVAVATLFLSKNKSEQLKALKVFESTFSLFGLDVLEYRDVPVNNLVLGESASQSVPDIKHAVINRPRRAITMLSFDKRLYTAKQLTKSKLYHLKIRRGSIFHLLISKNNCL